MRAWHKIRMCWVNIENVDPYHWNKVWGRQEGMRGRRWYRLEFLVFRVPCGRRVIP